MSTYRFALGFLKPYKRAVVLAVGLLALVVVADLSIPRLVQTIIDQGIVLKDMQVILNTSLVMIGATALSALLAIANTILSVRVAQSFAADLRKAVYHKVQSFSFGNLDRFQTGKLLVRLTSDINQLQMMILFSLRMLTRAPLMIVGSVGLMLATNLQLAMMVLLILPLTLLLIMVFVRVAQPLFLAVQKKLDALNQVLQENLAGVRVVKAFVREDFENERFNDANTDLMKQSIKVARLLSILIPVMFVLINLTTVALVYFGGLQAIAGTITVGEIVAFTNYLLLTAFPLLFLAMMAGQMSAANASAERIMEVIDSPSRIQDLPDARVLTEVKGRVVFENVCFSYSEDCGEPVLMDVNLTAEPGQTVAILGSTGSGKSSLVHLIPRFYDATKGRVTIDGIDVREVTQNSLRSRIGTSLQEAVLFSGTIRDNIRYGRSNATEEEVIAAAEAAQAHDFIMSFPSGYDTLVGQRGVNLSGGQKQRIAIARALLINPRILILDDSTSSVDVETEARIQDALGELMKDRTIFVVAQRVSTVLDADKIVVLDKGKIAGEGRHAELMATSPIYREIYESQLGDGGPG
ncbi:MAG: ABC transporter ATP-binding protein/permease, partial [Candidatus Bathyarchaeota archaeon]|nr:ABC transporter ATP-binding protein/permease [Candidatus Bathyarchaeota archaeon]